MAHVGHRKYTVARVDLDKYRVNKQYLVTKAGQDLENKKKVIGRLAVANHVPIIAVACYIGEEYGFDKELSCMIKKLVKFYDIEAIDNIRAKDDDNSITWLGKGHPIRCACADCVDPEETNVGGEHEEV